MRAFEVLTLVSVFLALVAFLLPAKPWVPKAKAGLPILTAVLVIVHLVIEKYRWTMAPIYVLSALLVVVGLVQLSRLKRGTGSPAPSQRRRWIPRVLAILGIVIMTGATLLQIQFPVVRLPSPNGPLAVGTTFLRFVDEERPETLTADPNDTREFMARVWYPAEPSPGAKPMQYQEYAPRIGSISPDGPPDFVFSHLARAASNSYMDAPVSAAQPSYPVLVFSDGFLSDFDGYQLFMEELASHGYVVFSLDNPYESRSVVQPENSSVVPFRAEHGDGFREHMETIIPLWQRFWTDADVEARNEIARQILSSESFMDNVVHIRVADVRFAVDEMERMNSGERENALSGRLDLSNLGVFGHSMGGAVAGLTCMTDARFRAGVNLDGFQWGPVVDSVIAQPFMLMYSEPFAGANDYILDRFTNTLYAITVRGSTHMNFEDAPLVLPITQVMGMAGSIPPARMTQITNGYLLAFFDRYLKGGPAARLDDLAREYPEAQVEVWR